MVKKNTLSGVYFIAPVIIGAYLASTFSISENSALPFSLFQITLLGSFAAYLLFRLRSQNLSVDSYGFEKEYLYFFIIIFFSLIYSPERGQGIFYGLRFAVLIGLSYFIYNAINNIKELKILSFIIIAASLVVALQGIYEIYLDPQIAAFNYLNEGKKLIRARGTESDPNIYAISLLLPCLLLVAYTGTKKELWKKLFLFCVFGVLVLAILITYSRSTYVALFFGSLFVMFTQKKFHFLYFGFTLSIVLIFISDTFRESLISIFIRISDIFGGTEDDSSNVRIMLLIGAIKMFFDSYTFGVGFQGFSTKFLEYYTIQDTIGVFEPHNEFYTILAELGIVGFVIFLVIIWKYLKKGYQITKRNYGDLNFLPLALFSALIGYMLFYQFYGGMLYNSLFFINLGLLFSFEKVSYEA